MHGANAVLDAWCRRHSGGPTEQQRGQDFDADTLALW